MTNENPILEYRMYEIGYHNGYVAAMASNVIAEKLFTQVDQEGNRFVIIDFIIDTRTDGTKTLQQDTFVITKSGTKRIKIQLKDGKSAYNRSMAVLHGTNLKISRIRIQYKWQSTQLIIEFWGSQHSHCGLNTC